MNYICSALIIFFLRISTSCGANKASDLQHLAGKNEAEVIAELGEPDSVAYCDSGTINEDEHSAAEVNVFYERTKDRHLEYGAIIIEINLTGRVFSVVNR